MELGNETNAGTEIEENLYIEGGEDADETDVVEKDTKEETAQTEPAKEESTEEATEETKEEDSKEEVSKKELNDDIEWVKKRLSRQKRADEKAFVEYATSMSEGVPISKDEIPAAVRLWNLLKNNKGVNSKVTEAISEAYRNKTLKELHEISGVVMESMKDAELAVREAKFELKSRDLVYRKYEAEILEFAEDEGIDVSKPEGIKRAYREWKGENAQKLMVHAEKVGTQKAQQNKQTKEKAVLQGSATNVGKPAAMDYRNASDAEILRREKLNLFNTEE